MRMTRRSFLKSLLVAAGATTVPIVVGPQPAALETINDTTRRVNYAALYNIQRALNGKPITVMCRSLDNTRAEYALIAKRSFDADLRMVCGSSNPMERKASYRLAHQNGAALITFVQSRKIQGRTFTSLWLDEVEQ